MDTEITYFVSCMWMWNVACCSLCTDLLSSPIYKVSQFLTHKCEKIQRI